MKWAVGIRPGDTDKNPLAHDNLVFANIGFLKEGEYHFPLHFLIACVTLLDGTLYAVANRLSLSYLNPVFLINCQVTLGIRYYALANMTLNFSQRDTTSAHG
jgi:hypothetical protein